MVVHKIWKKTIIKLLYSTDFFDKDSDKQPNETSETKSQDNKNSRFAIKCFF